MKEDRETGKVVQKPCLFKAKFHYTDPTRTKSVHVVGYELNSTTRTRQRARTLSVSGPCRVRVRVRVRVVEFSSYSTTCADFVRVGSVSGPCSGI